MMWVRGVSGCTLACLAVVLFAARLAGASTDDSGSTPAADFVVAPDGNDANPGTRELPFATLARARDEVRSLRAGSPNRDVWVLLRGGTYRVKETVVFSMQDSVAADHATTYAAWPGEKPVLSGGVPIVGWEKSDDLPGLPQVAKGKVWSAPVPAGVDDVVVLFDGDSRLPRARGSGFVPPPAPKSDVPGTANYEMEFPQGAVAGQPGNCKWDLLVVPMHAWCMNILPISEFDADKRMLRTSVPATYGLGKVSWAHFPNGTAWIENAPEVLDEPGEWVFDAKARRLYLWPTDDKPSADIVAPVLTEMIRIEGAIAYDRPKDYPLRGLVFRGLTFTHGDRFRWRPDKIGWGVQHDWEMFDRPTALVRLRGTEECVFEVCRFVNTGGTAVRLDLHAQRNVIRGNLIARTGGVGVLLAGYGPGTKDVNRENRIEGNNIHRVGELLWHSPAIFVWQSGGNRIAGNLMHECPYTAVVVSGRIHWDRTGRQECSRTIRWREVDAVIPPTATQPAWAERDPLLHARNNVVEGNEISDVMKTLGDGNGIYVSGAGGGNVVRGNYIHHSPWPNMNAAIRCDDDQSGTVITRNIIWRTCGEGFINKGTNTITNNIFAEISPCLAEGVNRRRGFFVLPYGDVRGSVIEHNIVYSTDKTMPPLTEWRKASMGLALLRYCRSDRNLYFCTEDPAWAKAMLEEQCGYGVECHSIEADPRFVAVEKGDFRLQPGSPAHKLGIEELKPAVVDRTVFPFNDR